MYVRVQYVEWSQYMNDKYLKGIRADTQRSLVKRYVIDVPLSMDYGS